jgi:hypothetical protein
MQGGWIMRGDFGDDDMFGTPQDDSIFGNEGSDRMFGRGGADDIDALDSERDEVDGGSGSDDCNFDPIDSVVNCP